jgi:MATE family multidrug resistance protein
MTTLSIFSSQQARLLSKLAIPLILTGCLESSVGFFSTLFLAHLGPHELAAGAVVFWIFFTILVIIWGTLSSVSVVVAQKFGEKNVKAIPMILRDALLLALILSVPTVILLRNISPILLWLGQEPDLVHLGKSYMDALSWGMPFDLVGMVLMQFIIGLGDTRTNMIFTLSWVPVNIVCNYVFVFGKLGVPALGIAGIGWGTSLAFFILSIVLTLFLYINKHYRAYVKNIFEAKKPQFLAELIHIGLPMGSMYCIEVAFFLTLTLLMGRFGSASLAANQITLQFLGQVSVVTFSLAQAVTVRIGHTITQTQTRIIEQITSSGVILAMSFMLLVLFSYVAFSHQLIGIDLNTQDPNNASIITFAKQFMIFGALFQIIESVRFIFFGALRALKDTRFTLLVSILSFWGTALPIGYLLAMVLDWKGAGLWAGTLVGQTVAVILLYYRFRLKVRYSAKNVLALQN